MTGEEKKNLTARIFDPRFNLDKDIFVSDLNTRILMCVFLTVVR